jgi:hypothetical protein
MLLYRLVLQELDAAEREVALEGQPAPPNSEFACLFQRLNDKHLVNQIKTEWTQTDSGPVFAGFGREWLLYPDEGWETWRRNCAALRWLVANCGEDVGLPPDVQASLDETIGRARPLISCLLLDPRHSGLRLQVMRADGQPSDIIHTGWNYFDDFQSLWACIYASLLFPESIGTPGFCAGCGKQLPSVGKNKDKPSTQTLCNVCRPAHWKVKNPRKLAGSRKNEQKQRAKAKKAKAKRK